ncbi:MAG: alpha/beta fold hydrolase [Myxococcota bacterium]|nr:alpha/beta fold hydrolase [Myxococcota bacterium]
MGAVRYTQSSPRLAYSLYGNSGAPGLVFVNGLAGRQEVWFHQVREFREDFRILCLDNRGAGRSDASSESVVMRTYAEDLLRVMDEAGLNEAALVGLSFGGRILQELALLAPERVKRLVIGGTSCGGAPHQAGQWSLRALFRPGRPVNEEELLKRVIPALFGPRYVESHEKHLRILCRSWASAPPDPVGLERQWDAYDAFDLSNRLGEVACPTLIVHGEDDGLSPMANAEFLAEQIPGAILARLPGVGHSPNVESPALFNSVLSEFLRAS